MRMDFSDIKFNNPIESNNVQKSVSIKMPWKTIHCISSGIDDLFGNTSCLVQYTIRYHRVNGIYYEGFFFRCIANVLNILPSFSCSLAYWFGLTLDFPFILPRTRLLSLLFTLIRLHLRNFHLDEPKDWIF